MGQYLNTKGRAGGGLAGRCRIWVGCLICVLLLAACGAGDAYADRRESAREHAPPAVIMTRLGVALSTGTADDPGATFAPDYTVRFSEGDCPFLFDSELSPQAAAAITCGYMQVPQNRADPHGLTLEIAVAIIESSRRNPQPDPVVYLEGGPGGGAVYDAEWWMDSPLRATRQIILVDQRGTGFSWPNLGCPELYDESWDDVNFADSLAACRDRLEGMGVDLAAYHSEANALDLADLRSVLGIESWNLFGVSYGTRLALTALRDVPVGIRSVVLDGVYPPTVDSYVELPLTFGGAVNALLDGCAEDRVCRAAYPDLRQTFYDLILDLDEEPLVFSADEVNAESDVELDPSAFVTLITDSLYDTDLIPWLPMLIADMHAGDYELLADVFLYVDDAGYARQRPDDAPPVDDLSVIDADGMFYSVECYEEVSFATLAAAALRAETVDPLLLELLLEDVAHFFEACEIWLGGRVAVEKAGPIVSDVPALLLAGEYDPVTPSAWAKLAAATLSNHYYVEMPRGGHALFFADECFVEIVIEFLDDPSAPPDVSCVPESVRPFEVP